MEKWRNRCIKWNYCEAISWKRNFRISIVEILCENEIPMANNNKFWTNLEIVEILKVGERGGKNEIAMENEIELL